MSANRNDLLGIPRRKRIWYRVLKGNYNTAQTDLADLKIRGLEVGRWYKVTLRTNARVNHGGWINMQVKWADNGGTILDQAMGSYAQLYLMAASLTNIRSQEDFWISQAKGSVLQASMTISSSDGTILYGNGAGSADGYVTSLTVEEYDQDVLVDTNF